MTEQTQRDEDVYFESDGLRLSGILHLPDGMGPADRRPGVLVLHGFGTHKDTNSTIVPAQLLTEWGCVALRFDMRGCGDSEGERGRVLCLDQVADTLNAATFLASRAEVNPRRIVVIGSSFGGAVAIYAAGVDDRLAGVISCGGWGDGERKFRLQHPTPQAWERFTRKLEEGRRHREKTGESLWMDRYDIVPIPEHLRSNLPEGVHTRFPVETAISMLEFRADDVVGRIAPRPLLLLHPAADSVTPTEESIRLFERAGQPTDLHLLSDLDHFMFAEADTVMYSILREWLRRHFDLG